MTNHLEQLKKWTTIVADTGDIEAIKAHQPQDATTNPSLIYQAAQMEQYAHLVADAVDYAKSHAECPHDQLCMTMDKLTVNFGCEILKIVPGRVSTEVDARLSFNTQASIDKAHQLIAMYEEAGIPRERVLIKLASTWESIQACRHLEQEGIHCNMTLLFCLGQAVACADAGATLISPFVGRILDWYKKAECVDSYPPAEDPGVKSVTMVYNYYKKFGYKTEVMGASFRNADEITELAGCDLLTIAPKLLEELCHREGTLRHCLSEEKAKMQPMDRIPCEEHDFRWHLNEDPMATEKLAEGIRNFSRDLEKLEHFIQEKFLCCSPQHS